MGEPWSKGKTFCSIQWFSKGFKDEFFYVVVVVVNMPAYRGQHRVYSGGLEVFKFPLSWSENLLKSGLRETTLFDLPFEERDFYRCVNEFASCHHMDGEGKQRYMDTRVLARCRYNEEVRACILIWV